ncbi:cytochrome bc complex cytochrome b subunit [Herpetosiphon gulosus]|uniref:Cytochrome b6 n=1 Tax=Herpetosiphon gulosus TaxID=1973496 RepID=A0ABP9WUM4_9CHLR
MAVSPESKRKGFGGWLTEVSRSFFPSMGAREWRETLRGEPAPRPNPRMRVHSNSFWYHIRPRSLSEEATAWYYTMGLGWMSFFFFVLEAITGLVLMIYYSPSPNEAYATMTQIMNDVPLGGLMRNVHRLGAHFMVAVVILHMLRTYFTASYKAPRQFIWFTGMILLFMTLLLSFSGYLLPWDQLAFWAVTIGSSMADAAPGVGPAIGRLLRGGAEIGAGALLRFYLLHIFMLPMLTIIFISIHYYAVRKQEISPIHELFENKKPTKRKIPFLPDQVFFELAVIVVLTFAFIFINNFFWDAKLENHANALETPQHTQAPWYFFWLQGMLKLGDKIVWGLGIAGIIFGALFLLPYIDRNPSRRFKDRKFAVAGGIVSLIVFIVVSYGGLPAFGIQKVGSNELAVSYVPVEGEGRVMEVPFDQVPQEKFVYKVYYDAAVGDFKEGEFGVAEGPLPEALSPVFKEMLLELKHDVQKWAEYDVLFVRPTVTLTIEPWLYQQKTDAAEFSTAVDGLLQKRVTLDMEWTTAGYDAEGNLVETPEKSRYTQYKFLNRNGVVHVGDTEPRN